MSVLRISRLFGPFVRNLLTSIKEPIRIAVEIRPPITFHTRGNLGMSQAFTKEMARNIFYGGTAFFFLLFVALTFDTHLELPKRDNRQVLDPSTELGQKIAQGKMLWEENNCLGCHTLLGEGAYYAPELGNVYVRFNNSKDAIKGFIKSRPADGVPGRRSMPQFNFSDEELDAIAEFLKYASGIDTADWPPNVQG